MRTLVTPAAVIVLLVVSLTSVADGQRSLTSSGSAPGLNNAITGRVMDSGGRPSPGTFVTLLKESTSRLDGSKRIGMVSAILGIFTDAAGTYRLEHLPPGAYYVVAFPQNLPIGRNVPLSRNGHAITYYPSAIESSKAQPVTLGAADIVTANVSLIASPLFSVSGSVVAPPDGSQPWRTERLGLAHADGLFGLDGKGITFPPEGGGRFVIPNLPNGSYCLQMHVGAWPPPREVIPTGIYGARVTVFNRDVTNVSLAPIKMVRVSGRVTLNPAEREALQLASITLAGVPVNFDCNPGPTRSGAIREDLSFEFHAWPGMNHIAASRTPPGIIQTTAQLNGVEITETGIELREGVDVSGLVVQLKLGPTPAPR